MESTVCSCVWSLLHPQSGQAVSAFSWKIVIGLDFWFLNYYNQQWKCMQQTCREVILIYDAPEHIFTKGFCVCSCMPCFPLGPRKMLRGTGFAMAMHFHSPQSCCRLMTLLLASPPLLLPSGWFLTFSRWLEKFFPDTSSHWYWRPGHSKSSQRAMRHEMSESATAHKPSHGPRTVQALRNNQQPVCHCTGMAGVREMWQRLTGTKNKVVFLEAACGVDCLCTLPSCFLQIPSKLFPVMLEPYMRIVFLLLNSREICLERGSSYFSKKI